MIVQSLTVTEEIIYRRLIRLSWGWGRNYCRAGINYFQKTSGISSRTTIKSAIDKLVEKKLIYRYIEEDGSTARNQDGTVYVIPLPNMNKSEEISVSNNGIPNIGTPAETTESRDSEHSIPNNGILKDGIPENGIPNTDTAGIPDFDTPAPNQVKTSKSRGIPNIDPNKYMFKDNLKDTLST